MSGFVQTGGASPTQKGEAAGLRTYVDKKTSKELSDIVHSGDRNPHKHGYNKYADPTNSYDEEAQTVIDAAAAARGKSKK